MRNTRNHGYKVPHLGSVSSRDIASASLLQFTRHAAQHEVLMLSSRKDYIRYACLLHGRFELRTDRVDEGVRSTGKEETAVERRALSK